MCCSLVSRLKALRSSALCLVAAAESLVVSAQASVDQGAERTSSGAAKDWRHQLGQVVVFHHNDDPDDERNGVHGTVVSGPEYDYSDYEGDEQHHSDYEYDVEVIMDGGITVRSAFHDQLKAV